MVSSASVANPTRLVARPKIISWSGALAEMDRNFNKNSRNVAGYLCNCGDSMDLVQ